MRAVLFAAAAGVVAIAAPAAAQTPKQKSDSTCSPAASGKIECRVYWERTPGDSAFRRAFYRMDSAAANRPALGLQLRATGTKRDTLGVFVEAVTPKGPAEVAGIVEGDRIAAINGVDLRSSAADIDDPYTNGLASHRLSREVQKLTPGSRVTVRVYSGGRFRDVQVVAGKASEVMRFSNNFQMRVPGPGGAFEFGGPGGLPPDMMMFRTPMIQRFKQPGGTIRLRAPGRNELLPGKVPQAIRLRRAAPLRVDAGSGVVITDSDALDQDDDAFTFDADEWLDTYDDMAADEGETFEVRNTDPPPK
jgi:hypothetical protein